MSLTFPDLPYAHDALEPHIDAKTMEIHHGKHHRTYYDKMLAALEGKDELNESIEAILAKAGALGAPVRNNAGGFYNHNLFWTCMKAGGGGEPTGALAEAIEAKFGGGDALRAAMSDAGVARFGSGFVWLIVKDGELSVVSTPNQDNPLMDVVEDAAKGVPILCIDVWEHAYYLSYQNRRPDYLAAFWNVVDWDAVAQRYAAATA